VSCEVVKKGNNQGILLARWWIRCGTEHNKTAETQWWVLLCSWI